MRLGGKVGSCSQVGVYRAVAGAVVREGVWSLGHGRSDVGLLPTVTPSSVCSHVRLSLAEIEGLLLLEMGAWTLLPIGDGS